MLSGVYQRYWCQPKEDGCTCRGVLHEEETEEKDHEPNSTRRRDTGEPRSFSKTVKRLVGKGPSAWAEPKKKGVCLGDKREGVKLSKK